VFVRGFDFGTTDEQLEAHMSSVGAPEEVKWITKGSAEVTYRSAGEAAAAVEQLNNTTIEGNSRFIDVLLAKEDGDRPTKRLNSGGKGRGNGAGSCGVFVRGFDFGTTDEQLEAHMSSVGTLEELKWITKGSAEVTYSSAGEAAAAVEQLQQTTIEGNSRFIDVLLAKQDGDRPTKSFRSGGKGGGNGQWVLMETLQSAFGSGGKSFGKGGGFGSGGKSFGKGGGGGKSGQKGGKHKNDDPPGSGRVFARGFDFGTNDEQFEDHMSTVGAIHQIHWVTKGSAVVVYKRKASAVKAASQLNQTTIEGNSRFIDVLLKDE